MKTLALKKVLVGLLFASLSTGFAIAQSLSMSVTTKTYYGSYTPKHVLACWVTNSAGIYIYNIRMYGYSYYSYLTNWTSLNSSTKTTDGTTSATLTSHSPLTFTWNCKNTSSVIVPDGTYYLNLEFTEQSVTKQYVKYPFTKGTTTYTTVPTPVTANAYYTVPSITYTAPTSALTAAQTTTFDVLYSRTDRNLQLVYDATNHIDPELQLVNLKGQTLYKTHLKGSGNETIQMPDCAPGMYMIRLTDKEGWSQTRKLLI